MPVLGFQAYMTPMLQLLGDMEERKITDISEILADYFKLTEADLNELIPSGTKSRHYDRVGWAATYMKQAGLLTSHKRAWYQITERGIEVLNSGETVSTEFLKRYAEFQMFQTRTRTTVNIDSTQAISLFDTTHSQHTPDEILETAYQTLRNALVYDLLERLKEVSPKFFEQCVIDVLLAMGYGGSQREAAQRVGQSGDGGIDGVINEDRLGLDVIYLQAKRWQNVVGARDVRDFAGSLEEKKAIKGIFITTSDFTRDAREFVSRIGKRIILINGDELAQMMIDFGVGVSIRKTYVIKRLDEDYFSEE